MRYLKSALEGPIAETDINGLKFIHLKETYYTSPLLQGKLKYSVGVYPSIEDIYYKRKYI